MHRPPGHLEGPKAQSPDDNAAAKDDKTVEDDARDSWQPWRIAAALGVIFDVVERPCEDCQVCLPSLTCCGFFPSHSSTNSAEPAVQRHRNRHRIERLPLGH